MANLLQIIKLKALSSALQSMDEKEIVDVLETFGKKEFGDDYKKYIIRIQYKLASIVFELGQRAK